MDKVLDFEENLSQENSDNESIEELPEEEEITAEERAYYNSLVCNKPMEDFSELVVEKSNKNKQKKPQKSKKQSLFDLIEEKKSWKSSRAEDRKFKDGKIKQKMERRKFNPRPLPHNWDNEKGCIVEIVKEISKELFPTLNNESQVSLIKTNVIKPKVASIWSKMRK